MRSVLFSFLAIWCSIANAQSDLACPPGPFYCVPWDPPSNGGTPPPPPPPFIEVEPEFIQPEEFRGFIGRGEDANLIVSEGAIPDSVRKLLEESGIRTDPLNLYVLPDQSSGISIGGDYLIFNGIGPN